MELICLLFISLFIYFFSVLYQFRLLPTLLEFSSKFLPLEDLDLSLGKDEISYSLVYKFAVPCLMFVDLILLTLKTASVVHIHHSQPTVFAVFFFFRSLRIFELRKRQVILPYG